MAVVAPVKNANDFVYKNPFKNKAWSYIRRNPDLNFKGYQKASKDYQCMESVFDEVKAEAKLFAIWDPKELSLVPKTPSNMERIEALNHQSQPHKELPPAGPSAVKQIEPPPPQEQPSPIGNQVAMRNIPNTRRKLDPTLKEVVREVFRKKPTITYPEMQQEVDWPDLTTSNFYQIRSELIRMGELGPEITAAPGRKVTGDVALARQNLMGVTRDEAGPLTVISYKQKFGHHSISGSEFSRAHAWAMRKHFDNNKVNGTKPNSTLPIEKPATPVIKPEPSEPTPETSKPANRWDIMATITIPDSVPQQHHAAFKEAFNQYFEQRLGANNNAQCRLMADPTCIEIRRPVK